MKISITSLLTGIVLGGTAALAYARNAPVLPEPSTLSMLGLAAVAGIVIWRIKRKK